MPVLARTFQARIGGSQPALDALARAMALCERRVLARLSAGEDEREVARTVYRPLGLSAKHADYALRSVKAKLKAAREAAAAAAETLRGKLAAERAQADRTDRRRRKASAEVDRRVREIREAEAKWQVAEREDASPEAEARRDAARVRFGARLVLAYGRLAAAQAERDRLRFRLHQHERRIGVLGHRLDRAVREAEEPSLCLGSRELFLRQFRPVENGYATEAEMEADPEAARAKAHAAWLDEWRGARDATFMLEGQAASPGGNIYGLLMPSGDVFDLRLILPPCAAVHGVRFRPDRRSEKGEVQCNHAVTFRGLRFGHGAEEIRAALRARAPVSYRFHRDGRSWRVLVTVPQEVGATVGLDRSKGALALDLNADHVALCRVSADGNPLRTWRLPLVTCGMGEGTRLNLLRQVAAGIARLAVGLGLPVVSERLDFAAKKAALTSEHGARRARMLSCFAYAGFDRALASALARAGVRHLRVNPAFTSLIGRVSHAPRRGSSVHAAAALSIGRRAMGHSERPPRPVGHENGAAVVLVPDGGGRVALPAPARTRSGPHGVRRHVWSWWRRLSRGVGAARAAHARGRAGDGPPSPRSRGEASAPDPSGPTGRGGSPPPRASTG